MAEPEVYPRVPGVGPTPNADRFGHGAEAEEVTVPIRLVVQGRQRTPPRGFLIGLARLLGLDVWGNHLLGQRASREMCSAALVLVVVLVFELVAWTLLFNVLIHASEWRLSARTLLALLLGALFGTAVFVFEKSFITADFSEGTMGKILAYAVRLIVVFGAALATAQPVELLVFGGAIETRLHQENVLGEAVRQIKEYGQVETAARPPTRGEIETALVGTDPHRTLTALRTELAELEVQIPDLERQLKAAEREVATARGGVEQWQALLRSAQESLRLAEEEERADAAAGVARAERSLGSWRGRLGTATTKKASIERQLGEAREQRTRVESKLEKSEQVWKTLVEDERNRADQLAGKSEEDLVELSRWIDRLQGTAPGQTIEADGRRLEPKPADFIERLRVLEDLRGGRPPLWPRAVPELRQRAIDAFGLDAWVVSPDAADGDELAVRLHDDAELFDRIYRVAFIIALVIPLLTVAFKLLMARELRDYYSLKAQARAMNPEAIEAWLARGKTIEDLEP